MINTSFSSTGSLNSTNLQKNKSVQTQPVSFGLILLDEIWGRKRELKDIQTIAEDIAATIPLEQWKQPLKNKLFGGDTKIKKCDTVYGKATLTLTYKKDPEALLQATRLGLSGHHLAMGLIEKKPYEATIELEHAPRGGCIVLESELRDRYRKESSTDPNSQLFKLALKVMGET